MSFVSGPCNGRERFGRSGQHRKSHRNFANALVSCGQFPAFFFWNSESDVTISKPLQLTAQSGLFCTVRITAADFDWNLPEHDLRPCRSRNAARTCQRCQLKALQNNGRHGTDSMVCLFFSSLSEGVFSRAAGNTPSRYGFATQAELRRDRPKPTLRPSWAAQILNPPETIKALDEWPLCEVSNKVSGTHGCYVGSHALARLVPMADCAPWLREARNKSANGLGEVRFHSAGKE